uniref:Uncharacterized protein MANES_10G151000 n=1 Tax=Rhizophora mucronata TaxID=61149 RepID=A0A2P2KDS7_RHIMU
MLVGTDEATTCVGLVIRNQRTGMISVAHMDSTKIVDIGITQMLSLVTSYDSDANLDVHMVGGFEDVSPKVWSKNIYSIISILEIYLWLRKLMVKKKC